MSRVYTSSSYTYIYMTTHKVNDMTHKKMFITCMVHTIIYIYKYIHLCVLYIYAFIYVFEWNESFNMPKNLCTQLRIKISHSYLASFRFIPTFILYRTL